VLDLVIGLVVGCAIGYFARESYRVIGASACAANAWSNATDCESCSWRRPAALGVAVGNSSASRLGPHDARSHSPCIW
jgi:hypothetical protein